MSIDANKEKQRKLQERGFRFTARCLGRSRLVPSHRSKRMKRRGPSAATRVAIGHPSKALLAP